MGDKKSRQLNVLIEMAALVNSTLDPKEVRLRAIESAMVLVGAEASSLILIDEEKRELFFEVALGAKGDCIREIRLKWGEGIAGWVAEHGVAQLVSDARSDERFFSHIDELCGFITRDLVCVPIRNKDKIIGVLEAVNRKSGKFEAEDMDILSSLSNQVAIALENAWLHKKNLDQLTRMVSEEKRHHGEKKKLLKDLHDGIGGITANIHILSELGQKADSTAEAKKALATISNLSREGVAEIRSFMNCLENNESTWHDLAAEFRSHGNSMIEPHNISFSIVARVSLDEEKPGIFLYMTLFRIFREALTNVIKHSGAKQVDVSFYANDERVNLTILDDGVGFKEGNVMGRGIANMKSRAAEIGGNMTIDSCPGARIHLDLPLPVRYPEMES
jgi:signal transduction histidine kinase